MLSNIKTFESNVKLGQVITKEEIHNWKGNVIFDCGTASGKTTFVLTNLSEYCLEHDKKILFVCNRKALAEETKGKILHKNISNVDVTTYQKIEDNIIHNKNFLLDYDYVALDECHHFLEIYNEFTDLSYDYFINHPSQKIFMSATCNSLFTILINKEIVPLNQYYKIKKNYDYLNEIVFYYKKNDYLKIIEDKLKNTDDKIIYFTQSIEEAIDLYKEYENIANFYCSGNNKNKRAERILAKNKPEDIFYDVKDNNGNVIESGFNGRLLVATKALDVGVTFLDKSIKTIIVNMFDHNSLQQCIGRKRLVDDEDSCSLYIRGYYKGQLNLYTQKDELEEMELFITDRDKYNEVYADQRIRSKYIYYDKNIKDLKLNKLALVSIKTSEDELNEMLYDEWINQYCQIVQGIGYKWFLLNKLGIKISDERLKNYEDFKEEERVLNLEEYLESIIGYELYKDDRNILIETVGLKDGRGRLQKSISQIECYLRENKIPYSIESDTNLKRKLEDGTPNPNFKKVYWIVSKKVYIK